MGSPAISRAGCSHASTTAGGSPGASSTAASPCWRTASRGGGSTGPMTSSSSPTAPEQWDLTFSGVYRLTPDLGTLSLLIDNFVFPNGLAFSGDERVLYVN